MRDASLILGDIVDSIGRLIELTAGRSTEDITADRSVAEAVLYNLVVLGEASKRVGTPTRQRFDDVDWSAMARTRDRLVHHYEGVDWEIVERIVRVSLPALLPRLVEIQDVLRAEDRASR
jgi:uncharacterized protein with HEPN domain